MSNAVSGFCVKNIKLMSGIWTQSGVNRVNCHT